MCTIHFGVNGQGHKTLTTANGDWHAIAFPFHTHTCTIMKLPTTIMKLHTQTPMSRGLTRMILRYKTLRVLIGCDSKVIGKGKKVIG